MIHLCNSLAYTQSYIYIAFYRDFYICIFTADLFTIAGKWSQFMANCTGMDNENVIYTTIYLLFIE